MHLRRVSRFKSDLLFPHKKPFSNGSRATNRDKLAIMLINNNKGEIIKKSLELIDLSHMGVRIMNDSSHYSSPMNLT